MTSDDAPETLLKAVREQAFKYVHKPVEPLELLTTVREALEAPEPPRIEVISARSDWVELMVPCSREAVNRIEGVMAQLETNLAAGSARVDRLRVSRAADERRRMGRQTRSDAKGARLVPARQADDPVSHRRSRAGFKIEDLPHAAIGQPPDDPIAHMEVREAKGLRPGGFGLLVGPRRA